MAAALYALRAAVVIAAGDARAVAGMRFLLVLRTNQQGTESGTESILLKGSNRPTSLRRNRGGSTPLHIEVHR